jgi:hypothetical protein
MDPMGNSKNNNSNNNNKGLKMDRLLLGQSTDDQNIPTQGSGTPTTTFSTLLSARACQPQILGWLILYIYTISIYIYDYICVYIHILYIYVYIQKWPKLDDELAEIFPEIVKN